MGLLCRVQTPSYLIPPKEETFPISPPPTYILPLPLSPRFRGSILKSKCYPDSLQSKENMPFLGDSPQFIFFLHKALDLYPCNFRRSSFVFSSFPTLFFSFFLFWCSTPFFSDRLAIPPFERLGSCCLRMFFSPPCGSPWSQICNLLAWVLLHLGVRAELYFTPSSACT